jgi:hypothetical protein
METVSKLTFSDDAAALADWAFSPECEWLPRIADVISSPMVVTRMARQFGEGSST